MNTEGPRSASELDIVGSQDNRASRVTVELKCRRQVDRVECAQNCRHCLPSALEDGFSQREDIDRE